MQLSFVKRSNASFECIMISQTLYLKFHDAVLEYQLIILLLIWILYLNHIFFKSFSLLLYYPLCWNHASIIFWLKHATYILSKNVNWKQIEAFPCLLNHSFNHTIDALWYLYMLNTPLKPILHKLIFTLGVGKNKKKFDSIVCLMHFFNIISYQHTWLNV